MYKIAVAGSSKYSLLFAKTLSKNRNFTISWILTPSPKPKGRNKELINNPLHSWALEKNIPVVLVGKQIDAQVKKQIEQKIKVDYLLVVDFGYLIPSWLLKQPDLTALNIHPSALPKYRGSSPGQMLILNGEKKSAVSLIKLNEKIDQGPIIAQIPFDVPEKWTQKDYYDNSFYLMAERLAELIIQYSENKLKEKPQTIKSPTPIARRLSKQDSYVSWNLINKLILNYSSLESQSGVGVKQNQKNTNSSGILMKLITSKTENKIAETVCRASKAFYPWPMVWTIVPTNKGQKIMKILPCKIKNGKIELLLVQIEGKKQCLWREVKNSIKSSIK